jgi:hypothetical protein
MPKDFFSFSLLELNYIIPFNKLVRFVDNDTSCCARHNDTSYHEIAQVSSA